jgi:hypothetical protein
VLSKNFRQFIDVEYEKILEGQIDKKIKNILEGHHRLLSKDLTLCNQSLQ